MDHDQDEPEQLSGQGPRVEGQEETGLDWRKGQAGQMDPDNKTDITRAMNILFTFIHQMK